MCFCTSLCPGRSNVFPMADARFSWLQRTVQAVLPVEAVTCLDRHGDDLGGKSFPSESRDELILLFRSF